MKKSIKVILVIFLSIVTINISAYAHSGKTDGNGGHKDKNNVSGLGNYHYHCGGNPPHLHTNGVCQYSVTSNNKSIQTKEITQNIEVTGVAINETEQKLEIGQSITLHASVLPQNATDQTIKWKSNDISTATIDKEGKVVAKKSGVVEIEVNTKNGKNDKLKIVIKENEKNPINTSYNVIKTSTSNTNTDDKNKENTNPFGGVIVLGIISGIGYYIYKKSKK